MGRSLNSSSSRNYTRTELVHSSSWPCRPSAEHPPFYSKGPLRSKNFIHILLSTTTSCERLLKVSEVITRMWKPSSYSTHNQFLTPYWTTRKLLVSLIVQAGVQHIKMERPRKRLRCRLVRLFLVICELYSSLDPLSGYGSNVYGIFSWLNSLHPLFTVHKWASSAFFLFLNFSLCTPSSFLAHSISTTLST